MRPAPILAVLLSLGAGRSLAAQEQPAHLASCTTDSAARFFLEEVRYLLAAVDSSSAARRRVLDLVAIPSEQATLVTEDQLCLEATRAAGLHPPYPLAVVRAGDRYLVRLPDRSRRTILSFDLRLRRLGIEEGQP